MGNRRHGESTLDEPDAAVADEGDARRVAEGIAQRVEAALEALRRDLTFLLARALCEVVREGWGDYYMLCVERGARPAAEVLRLERLFAAAVTALKKVPAPARKADAARLPRYVKSTRFRQRLALALRTYGPDRVDELIDREIGRGGDDDDCDIAAAPGGAPKGGMNDAA